MRICRKPGKDPTGIEGRRGSSFIDEDKNDNKWVLLNENDEGETKSDELSPFWCVTLSGVDFYCSAV